MTDGLEYVCFKVASREDYAAKFATKDLGVGLLLAMYCGEKLNGGVIKDARHWTKNEWLLRVHIAEKLNRNCHGLWQWDGNDLIVECYDNEVEKRVLSKREKRTEAANARWRKAEKTDANALQVQCKPDANLMHSREVEVKVENSCKAESVAIPQATHTLDASQDVARSAPFRHWLAAFTARLPWLADYNVLPLVVQQAAVSAFVSIPGAVEQVDLLGAFYASKLEEDSRRRTFWRPRGAKFFEEIVDVIQHAERWDRETHWSAKKRRKESPPPQKNSPQPATEEEQKAFLEALKKLTET